MVIGEAACTKDLMKTTDRDFKMVSKDFSNTDIHYRGICTEIGQPSGNPGCDNLFCYLYQSGASLLYGYMAGVYRSDLSVYHPAWSNR